MNFIRKLEEQLSPIGYKQAIKAIVNGTHNQLMILSSMRLNNIRLGRDVDYTNVSTIPTIDTPAGEAGDEAMRMEHTQEVGFETGMTLTQRADCYASIQAECFKIAEEKGWTGQFDKPMSFAQFVDFRITSIRGRVVTPAQIAQHKEMLFDMSEEEIKLHIQQSIKREAGQLEANKANLVAELSSYETNIDPEEAIHSLGKLGILRMQLSVLNSLYRECLRLATSALGGNIQPARSLELFGMRTELVHDAIALDATIDAFEKEHYAQIEREANGNQVPSTTAAVETWIRAAKRGLKEEQDRKDRLAREEKKAA